MHILLVHQLFAALDEPGGTRHHELARFLVQQGHRVTVITSPVSYLTGAGSQAERSPALAGCEQREEGNLTILRPYTYSGVHRSFVHRVIGFLSFMISSFIAGLRVPQVDLVWGTSPPIFQGLTAWALARIHRAAFVFEVRDLWPAFAVQMGVLHNRLLIWASERLERFLYRHADRLLVNSPGFIGHLQRRGARQVDLIPNGADPRMFDPSLDGAEFRQAHNLGDRFVVLYAGAHGLANDLGVVLQAAGLLRNQAEILIVLLGDGKEKENLVRQAEALDMANVQFIPSIPKKEMAQALAAADACLAILQPIPLFATVYPNKVFDYMAAGRPVILAIDGVIRQVVEQAQAGLSIPAGDAQALAQAIRKLAQERSLGQAMGKNGRQYIETHFDRAVLAGRLEQIFREMCQ